MEKSDFAKQLGELFQDIRTINVTFNSTRQEQLNEFYKIMKKWGICQGTWTEGGGRSVANYEWTLCKDIFNSHVNSSYSILEIFDENIPEEILGYGKPPKTKTKK